MAKVYASVRRKARRSRVPRVQRRKAGKPRPRGSFVRAVKAVVSALTETKQAFYTTGDAPVKFNSGIDSLGDMRDVLPQITQSTADNGRIGDQIRAKSLNIKGFVKLDIAPTIGTVGMPNVVVRMMVVSLKSKTNFTEATSSVTPLGSLIKKGGTTSTFSGVLRDINAPVNTDIWTVHSDKKYYLKQDYVNGSQGPMDVSNTVRFFNIKLKCKNKLLKYDSAVSSALLPTNYGPMILLGYSFLDGTTPDTINTRVGLQYDTILNYEDA